jgi:adenine-specific DNA-methyltransferase
MGVGSTGVAAAIHNRRFLGAEIVEEYASKAATRIKQALNGHARYRPHDKPLYDHTLSNLSKLPEEFRKDEFQ